MFVDKTWNKYETIMNFTDANILIRYKVFYSVAVENLMPYLNLKISKEVFLDGYNLMQSIIVYDVKDKIKKRLSNESL
jgi:hypothetical protein